MSKGDYDATEANYYRIAYIRVLIERSISCVKVYCIIQDDINHWCLEIGYEVMAIFCKSFSLRIRKQITTEITVEPRYLLLYNQIIY